MCILSGGKLGCVLFCLGAFGLWWLVASGFLYLCWNEVIAKHFAVKPAKYSQALLLLATVAILVAPCAYMKRKLHNHSYGAGCHHGDCYRDSDCDKGDCDKDKGQTGEKKKGKCPYQHLREEKAE